MLKILVDILVLSKMIYIGRARNRFTLLALIVMPIIPPLYMRIFGINIVYGFAGALVMAVVTAGLNITSDIVFYRKVYRLQDMFVASPVSPIAYVISFAITSLLLCLPGIIILLILLCIILKLGLLLILEIILVLFITWIMSISLSFAIATRVENPTYIGSLSTLTSIFLGILPPVYYPLEIIPLPFRTLAYIAPTTHPAEIIREIISGNQSYNNILIYWLMLILYSIFFIILALRKAQWREK